MFYTITEGRLAISAAMLGNILYSKVHFDVDNDDASTRICANPSMWVTGTLENP